MPEVDGNYTCYVCNIMGLTHQAWKDHHSTDDHLAKVKRLTKNQLFCTKCNHQFENQRLFDRHCESKKHKFGQLTLDELFCHKCNTQCYNKAKWDEHILTRKHASTKVAKTQEELFCNKCNTQCHNDSEWAKHILTKKHNAIRDQERHCDACNCDSVTDVTWAAHLKTKKHIRNTKTNGTEIHRTIQQTVDQGSQTD